VTLKGVRKRGNEVRGRDVGAIGFLGYLCMLGCSSVVVVEGAYVRDFRGIG
jgi:hypothetical protein